jgi:hypothetical protein
MPHFAQVRLIRLRSNRAPRQSSGVAVISRDPVIRTSRDAEETAVRVLIPPLAVPDMVRELGRDASICGMDGAGCRRNGGKLAGQSACSAQRKLPCLSVCLYDTRNRSRLQHHSQMSPEIQADITNFIDAPPAWKVGLTSSRPLASSHSTHSIPPPTRLTRLHTVNSANAQDETGQNDIAHWPLT